MSNTVSRCPVTWRYILGLQARITAFPNGTNLYSDELSTLEDLKSTCQYIGRAHSAQLLRGFYLMELVLSKVWALSAIYPGYEWVILKKLNQEVPPPRSREGLTFVHEALLEQVDYLVLDVAESVLAGRVQVFQNFELARGAVTPTNSGAVKKYLNAIADMAVCLRSNLIAPQENISLGGLGVDANCAFDAIAFPVTPKVVVARLLTQITEENPLRTWLTKRDSLV